MVAGLRQPNFMKLQVRSIYIIYNMNRFLFLLIICWVYEYNFVNEVSISFIQ